MEIGGLDVARFANADRFEWLFGSLGKNVSVNAVARVTEGVHTKLKEILLIQSVRVDPRWHVLARHLEAFLIERRWYIKILDTWKKTSTRKLQFQFTSEIHKTR